MVNDAGLHEIHIVGLGRGGEPRIHLGFDKVVGLDDANVLARRGGEAAVHRLAVTAIRLVYDDESGIRRGVFADDRQRRVGRTVVDADEFHFRERLRLETVQALPENLLGVVDRKNDGDERTPVVRPFRHAPAGDIQRKAHDFRHHGFHCVRLVFGNLLFEVDLDARKRPVEEVVELIVRRNRKVVAQR